jgi:hypothetical protein
MTEAIGKSVYAILRLMRDSERNVKFNQMCRSQNGNFQKVSMKGRMKLQLRF